MRTRRLSRIVSVILCFALLFTVAIQGMVVNVSASSVYENENLVTDPSFENTDPSSVGDNRWGAWQNVSRTTAQSRTGTHSVAVTPANSGGSSLEQDIPGLQRGVTYTYSIWLKVNGAMANAGGPQVGVKNYGGAEIKYDVNATDTEWNLYSVDFTYTGTSSPRIFVWIPDSGTTVTYCDDASVVAKGDIKRAEITNGSIVVDFSDSFTGTPSAADFSATYTTSADGESASLALTEGSAADKTITLNFDAIAAIPVEQTVNVNLTYDGLTIPLDFTVEASGEEEVFADLVSVTAENGSFTAVLDKAPTVAPVADDFAVALDIDGTVKNVAITGFSYDAANLTVTGSFTPVSSNPETDKNVTVSVTYRDVTKTDSYVVEKGEATVYYIASNGDDNNNGTSEETPFASIEKLNTIAFNPGDKILFRTGDTFVGTFRPTTSGIEGYPIVVASYGEGSRPIIEPGPEWTIPRMMSAGDMNGTVNARLSGCFDFYNVEYWEVKDLELRDPSYDPEFYAVNTISVYRSGIRVGNLNMGDLSHFYFDNLVIHGFRGPGSNLGKSSGGINFNVYTDRENPDNNVKSAIVDMRVTNCEIYECGRSGINFLNPWALRRGTDDKWSAAGYGQLLFYPHRDFYMSNCVFHDIDGDALIVDNVSNAVVENNLCYRASIRLGSFGAAVGFFNWNSDDTYFQFNEVYDTGLNATQSNGSLTVPGDAQGIEVDALNDRTWVQYNYLHDNVGGLMMWCNVGPSYLGFDAIIRYNISENDYAKHHGIFNSCGHDYGSEFYNNVIYLDEENALDLNGNIKLFLGSTSVGNMKFYNNIFVYPGDEPKAANTFGDRDMDWRSNIFYGFTNLPENDDEGNPNISADPKLINPDSGVRGTAAGEICDLSGYKVAADSPAINAGVALASMQDETGKRDYFGNKLSGIPDIGVYESGSAITKIVSLDYEVNQSEKTITVFNTTTADVFNDSLIYDDGVAVETTRNGVKLSGGVYLMDGDIVTAKGSDETVVYTIVVVDAPNEGIVSLDHIVATAGSSETSQSSDTPDKAFDNNTGTLWHTSWNGADRSLHYITMEITEDYTINGLTYLPRQSGNNGNITKYRIEVSEDGENWTTAASGDWANDSELKTVSFDETNFKFVKLVSVESIGGFSSAAEIRILGTRIYGDEVPKTPVDAKADDVSGTCAKLTWTAPDDDTITRYIIKNGEEIVGTVTSDTFSYIVSGLDKTTEYTLSIYAENLAGKLSAAAEVNFTTTDSDALIQPGMLGDVNNSGVVDASDATLVLQYYAGIITENDKNFDISVADVDDSGAVDASDATLILQLYAGIISKF